jgi:hypothetical protein
VVRADEWSELAVNSPVIAMTAERGWRSALCAVAAILVVGSVSEGAAQATGPGGGSSSDFVQKCLEQNKNLPATTGYATDLNVVCACKAKKLREKGYDPDAMEGLIRDAYSKAIEQSPSSGSGAPVVDPAMRERLQKGVSRILKDDAAAFTECIRGDIERSVRKTMMKDMGRPL